jgi:hypothetical protein
MMKMNIAVFMALFLAINILSLGQGYAFDIPDAEAKKEALELSGNLDAKYSLLKGRKDSPLYILQNNNSSLPDILSSYGLNLYLNADYQAENMGFHIKTYQEYYSDRLYDFNLFELYGNLNLSDNFFILLGKKRYAWGKGYAYNPVGYINPVKDPENPELLKAGFLSINLEYSLSFQMDFIRNIAFDFMALPAESTVSNNLFEPENTIIAGKIYFLILDTDIDIMGYYSKYGPKKTGFDFSRNLLPNLEIHGECSWLYDQPRYTITNMALISSTSTGYSYLIGIRWLSDWNITSIFEYYHNDAGLTQEEFNSYYNFLYNESSSGNPLGISNAMRLNKGYFQNPSMMRDYLYLNLTWPEPLNMVYLTPSAYTIINMNDWSFIIGISLSYKPINNFELNLLPLFFLGNYNTEFGMKQFVSRMDLTVSYYF